MQVRIPPNTKYLSQSIVCRLSNSYPLMLPNESKISTQLHRQTPAGCLNKMYAESEMITTPTLFMVEKAFLNQRTVTTINMKLVVTLFYKFSDFSFF